MEKGRRDVEAIETSGVGVGASGIFSDVEVGVFVVRDLGNSKVFFERVEERKKGGWWERRRRVRRVLGRGYKVEVSSEEGGERRGDR